MSEIYQKILKCMLYFLSPQEFMLVFEYKVSQNSVLMILESLANEILRTEFRLLEPVESK